jgi:ComF family protein
MGSARQELEALGAVPREGPLGGLWELLFPSRCLGCDQRGMLLCTDCRPTVPWLPTDVCPRCAARSSGGRVCRRCAGSGARRHLASVRAACTFDGVVRTAIHHLKFRQARYMASLLAQLLAKGLARRPIEADLVLPVPLSPSRHRQRGYNQSELIALAVKRLGHLPAPSPDSLTRVRDTRPQVGLPAAERLRNLRGAFRCEAPKLVAGRRCLLIDDVMTTGATLEACAEPLVQAGAERVRALVVAREF